MAARTFFSTFRSKNFLIVCPRGCFFDCGMGRCVVAPCQSKVAVWYRSATHTLLSQLDGSQHVPFPSLQIAARSKGIGHHRYAQHALHGSCCCCAQPARRLLMLCSIIVF